MAQLGVFKMGANGKVPVRASVGAAGYDLYSACSLLVQRGDRRLASTEIGIVLPQGYYGRIASRSSLAMDGVDVCAGVIDSDYRGEVKVMLHNFGEHDKFFARGDRIAQLIIEPCAAPTVVLMANAPKTVRGEGGFGSTGTGSVVL